MSDTLNLPFVLETDEKPSTQYRNSAYTVREYARLPYAQRLAVDEECNRSLRMVFTFHDHSSGHSYRLGRLPQAA
jgi:hypothetical protein